MSTGAHASPPPPPPHLQARGSGGGGGGGTTARLPHPSASSLGGSLADPWLPGRPASPPSSPGHHQARSERRAAFVRGGLAGASAALVLVALVSAATGPPSAPGPGRAGLRGVGASLDGSHPGAEGGALWGVGAEAARGRRASAADRPPPSAPPRPHARPPVLVSYAYFEKDDVQAANAAFFIAVGAQHAGAPGVAGGGGGANEQRRADVVFTVSGAACSPCASAAGGLSPLPLPPALPPGTLASAWGRAGFTLLHRTGNVGMDFGAHNASLAWAEAAAAGEAAAAPAPATPATPAAAAARRFGYAFFIFLNSSARGPFIPAYLPAGWHWTRAFTDGLDREGCDGGGGGGAAAAAACLPPAEAPPPGAAAALVAASLACLPPQDAGGPGPRAESWAFALSAAGLAIATGQGGDPPPPPPSSSSPPPPPPPPPAFAVRACKLCASPDAGIVVGAEYGLSSSILAAGRRLATLQARYARGTDWADAAHWGCNGCAHASRHGTYGPGLALHPFETVFVKASWGVGTPFLEAYTAWATGHVRGDDPGTGARAARGGGGGDGGGGGGGGAWDGPAPCDAALYRYAVSPAATEPAATAHVAACFAPPGLRNGSAL